MRIPLPDPYAAIVTGILATALVTLLAGPGLGQTEVTDPEVRACLERTQPEISMTQTVLLRVHDKMGSVSESRAKFFWKRLKDGYSRALVRLTSPPRRKGVAVLLLEPKEDESPEMYLYLPELRQTRRVTGKTLAGSFLGTDFSYEDFAHFQGILLESEVTRIEDREIDGRPAYVLETRPHDEESAYERVLTFIDIERCIPVRTEFYGRNGEVSKELVADPAEIREVKGRSVPHRMVMRDIQQESETELTIEEIEIDEKLRSRLFDISELESGA